MRDTSDLADEEDDADSEWTSETAEEIGLIRWVLSGFLIVPVRIYQQMISPLLGPTCRFRPTCSEYFIQSVKKHGPLRGSWRGVCRIARCHPFHPGGDDPP